MPVTQPVFRFAPSPNGALHLGHAYSALLNADLANRFGGRLLLRIEDIDTSRCRPEFAAGIEEDLHWLGLRWETPVRWQSEHFGDYGAAFSVLHARGLVYPCFCSRKELAGSAAHSGSSDAKHDPDGVPRYPGTCRHWPKAEIVARLARSDPHTWRVDMAGALRAIPATAVYQRMEIDGRTVLHEAHPERWGDAVIVRRDVPTSYHLSVVVDDALQGVTHVVRGQDLEAATDLHVLLQGLLGLPTPCYRHHPLIRDEEGGKLAKSRFSETLSDLRQRGVSPSDIRQRLGFV